MAEVLARFAGPVTNDGVGYRAQACAAPNSSGLWEGWIEFVPIGSGAPVRSARETTQPNKVDAEYWATGLTAVYLEGALNRALHPIVRKIAAPRQAVFDAPAPDFTVEVRAAEHDAILDPFSVYEKGESILRQELGALSAWHLVNIVIAYELSDRPVTTLNTMPAAALIELIVTRVRDNMMARRSLPMR